MQTSPTKTATMSSLKPTLRPGTRSRSSLLARMTMWLPRSTSTTTTSTQQTMQAMQKAPSSRTMQRQVPAAADGARTAGRRSAAQHGRLVRRRVQLAKHLFSQPFSSRQQHHTHSTCRWQHQHQLWTSHTHMHHRLQTTTTSASRCLLQPQPRQQLLPWTGASTRRLLGARHLIRRRGQIWRLSGASGSSRHS